MKKSKGLNKQAWEYRAYEFWTKRDGSPATKALQLMANPLASLKRHQHLFSNVKDLHIGNLCGSNGRRAVPLALLGAHVTIFDLSEENKRYALELAAAANVTLDFVVTDLYEIDIETYAQSFDILYLEGGILHYFDDLNRLSTILFSMLKPGGRLILSDYHPIKRCITEELVYTPTYFDETNYEADVSFKQFFDKEEQHRFPSVSLHHHTMSSIINSVISNGFIIQRVDEHRGWKNENIPWEFTLLATKN